MTADKQIKAYAVDESGQLSPIAADALLLEFPSGDSLEIAWDAPPPDDPHPVCAQVWGGRRNSKPLSQDEIDARTRATTVALLPYASNLVLVHPYSYPVSKRTKA